MKRLTTEGLNQIIARIANQDDAINGEDVDALLNQAVASIKEPLIGERFLSEMPTLRDQFAMAALEIIPRITSYKKLAADAYFVADAMLEARVKK